MGLHNYRRRDNGQERLETPSYALPTINHDDNLASMTSTTSKCQMIDIYETQVIYGNTESLSTSWQSTVSPETTKIVCSAQQLVGWRSCSNLWGVSPRCIPIDLNDTDPHTSISNAR